jgi:hypothetical protein
MALEQVDRLVEQGEWVWRLVHINGKQLAEPPGARETLAQTEHVPGDMVHGATFGKMTLDVGPHGA